MDTLSPDSLLSPDCHPQVPRAREWLRKGCQVAVAVPCAEGEQCTTAELIEFSARGVTLQVTEPIDLNADVAIRLEADHLEFAVDLPAHVLSARRQPTGVYMLDCDFVPALEDQLIDDLVTCGVLELRRFPRQPISLAASGWLELESRALDVQLCDMSQGGVGLITCQRAQADQRLRVRTGDGALDLILRVKNCQKTANGFRLGCEFQGDGDYKRLAKVVGASDGAARATSLPQNPSHADPSPRQRGGWFQRLWNRKEEAAAPAVPVTPPHSLSPVSQPADTPPGEPPEAIAGIPGIAAPLPATPDGHVNHMTPTEEPTMYPTQPPGGPDDSQRIQELEAQQSELTELRKEWDRFGTDLREREEQLTSQLLELCREPRGSSTTQDQLTSELQALREENERLLTANREQQERSRTLEGESRQKEQHQIHETQRLHEELSQLRQEVAQARAREQQFRTQLVRWRDVDGQFRKELENSIHQLRTLLESDTDRGALDSWEAPDGQNAERRDDWSESRTAASASPDASPSWLAVST